MMTPEEFKEKMAFCNDKLDEEDGHYEADGIMCKLLKELGYGEGVKIFKAMAKWYS